MKEFGKQVRLSKPIDVDKIGIRKDHYFPNAYVIDLPLDSVPDHVWLDIFERQWKSSRHLWDRKLFVVGDKLRLVTSPDTITEKLDWVKEMVDATNLSIEDYNRETIAEAAQIAQVEEELTRRILAEEKATMEMIRSIVRKRFRNL